MCHPPGALMGLVDWCSTLWTDVPTVCSDVMFHRVNWCAATECTDVPPPGHWQLCADWWWLAKLGKMTIAGACYYWFLDITFLFLITMIIYLSGNLISQSDSMAITELIPASCCCMFYSMMVLNNSLLFSSCYVRLNCYTCRNFLPKI